MKRSLISLLFFAVLTPFLLAQTASSLEDVLDLALKNNFDIRISRSASQIAEANNTAGNAGMLPTVSLNGSAGIGQVDQTASTYSYVSGNANVQLNWTLYDGGKMFVTRQKLRETSSLGAIRFQETVLEKTYQVVEAYYDLVRLKQQLRSVQQTIRYNQERVTIAQAGFTAGSLSKPDLLQAKTDLNEVLESAITQEFAIREGQRYLNTLLARDTETPLVMGDTIPDQYQPNREDLVRRLNANNVSLQAFQKQVEINRLALKETKSNYLPTFNVNANYEYAGQNKFNNAGSNFSLSPNINGNLSIPIYQAGESNRKKKVAELTVESSQTDLENLKLQLNLALQNALNDFENQKALLNIEEENNLMTKEYLEISIQRLRLGQTNSLEVHLAQEKFMNSNTRLINYRFNLKLAETKLRQLVASL
jgi:outer membrane protein